MFQYDKLFKTTLIDETVNIQRLLMTLRQRETEWEEEDSKLEAYVDSLDPSNKIHIQMGAQIASLRRCLRMHLVEEPLEISLDAIEKIGYEDMRQKLANQFTDLSKSSRKLWLMHFLFILTPDLRRLSEKIQKVRAWKSLGQQRNFLLGGPSGNGKTTCLNWVSYKNRQQIEAEYNRVSVIKIDAPVSNKSPKPMFQRIILQCGHNYVLRDGEEELLNKIILLFQQCRTEVLIIDEIEHVSKDYLKRRLVEISNLAVGVPIICASCQPTNWIGTDVEIRGRWNDYLHLEPYTGKRLQELLSFINLLLPFNQTSNLNLYEIEIEKGKQMEVVDGPAKLIERWTGGILRDIMILVVDSALTAIELGHSNLSPSLLQQTWTDLQDRQVTDFLELFKNQ